MKPILEVYMTYSVHWSFIFSKKTLPYPSNSMLHCSWKADDYTELVEVPVFSEPKGSLPYSQMPVIDPYLEQVLFHLFTSCLCNDWGHYYPGYT